jgi:DNA-binding beta-propeller fold protein YncE
MVIHLATALFLNGLAGGFVADAQTRSGRHEDATFLVASEAAPTTTAIAGPVVEFLWAADGAPAYSLDRPTAAAIDPDGNLWVTDGANDRFVIFSPGGVALEAWGTPGSGDGEFDFECRGLRYGGVAFDADGNIYVADAGNQRIQKFASDRAFLTSWPSDVVAASQLLVTGRGNQGAAEGESLCPAAIAVDRQGRVYVSNRNPGTIAVFDPDGEPLPTGMEGLVLAQSVAIAGDGTIWVADTANRILHFAPNGSRLAEWRRYGSGEGAFIAPLGIAVDAEGRVFVSDQGYRVQIFSPDGQFLAAWWSRGIEGEPFDEPVALVLDGVGNIYVVEQYGPRVQKFRLLSPFAQ